MLHKIPFRIVHASGQDENYKASELNFHGPLTRGWQSGRFCLYPQDIVLQLNSKVRLCKIQILSHQYLIATKIEFFVGDIPHGAPFTLPNARYIRLGYISLSNNEKTLFQARELKSVHLDAVGGFLKLNIHKNHVNKYNLYNQVGIIAINIIGEDLEDATDTKLMAPVIEESQLSPELPLDSYPLRPDYISPLDDLAFDMYQDPGVAQLIRKLERKKQEAVLQERYEFAKRVKQSIEELRKGGERLGKLEIEKRQAVENEDFDTALLKKVQIEEFRLQMYQELNINALLENDMPQQRQPSPVLFEHPPRFSPPVREAPLPQQSSLDVVPLLSLPHDERPLPTVSKPLPVVKTSEEETAPSDSPGAVEGEHMTEKDLREASSAIDLFGLNLVSKIYSKTWSTREEALLTLSKQMADMNSSTSKEDVRSMMRAIILLVKRGIDDQVSAVVKADFKWIRMLLTEFVPKFRIPRSDIVYFLEKVIPHLLRKSGDTTMIARETKKFLLEMAVLPEVKFTNVVTVEAVKPFKLSVSPKLAQSRAEIVQMLYQDLGVNANDNTGLTIENVMEFCNQAMKHSAKDVRRVAIDIIHLLYKDAGARVREFLPPDDEKIRKNTLYRQLFEYFDKVDGKPSKEDLQHQKRESEARKQAEIDTLEKQLQEMKNTIAAKPAVEEAFLKENGDKIVGEKLPAKPIGDINIHINIGSKEKKKEIKSKKKGVLAPSSIHDPAEEDDLSTVNMDKTCIFCGETNDSFTEKGLDLHYWRSCPMLRRCGNCRQVLEISSYTNHLLTECDARENYRRCVRCREAILKEDYDEHLADKTCNASDSTCDHCPLCHVNLTAGEEGWKEHLMGADGCKQNPRRLLAQNKPGLHSRFNGPSKAKHKSSIPVPKAHAEQTRLHSQQM